MSSLYKSSAFVIQYLITPVLVHLFTPRFMTVSNYHPFPLYQLYLVLYRSKGVYKTKRSKNKVLEFTLCVRVFSVPFTTCSRKVLWVCKIEHFLKWHSGVNQVAVWRHFPMVISRGLPISGGVSFVRVSFCYKCQGLTGNSIFFFSTKG